MTAPIATALPRRLLVLLMDAPLLKGEGLGGGTGVPAGEPGPEPELEPEPEPEPEPVATGDPVPEATKMEVALVGKGAALVL